MSIDVFISYSSKDHDLARDLKQSLEANGYATWMTPDDVRPNRPWAEQIVAAIDECRAILVLVSRNSNASEHVSREVNIAVTKAKPVLPVRVEDVNPGGSLEFLLSLKQWVDAFPGPINTHIEDLQSAITTLINDAGQEAGMAVNTNIPLGKTGQSSPAKSRKSMWLLAAGIIGVLLISCLAISGGGLYYYMSSKPAVQKPKAKTFADYKKEGEAAYDKKDFKKAVELLTQATKLNPNSFNVWVMLADSYVELESYSNAVYAYKKAVSFGPNNEGALSQLGYSLYMSYLGGSLSSDTALVDEAIAAYQKALDVNPKNGDSWYYQGRCYEVIGDWEKALFDLQKATELDPSDAYNWLGLGEVYDGLGQQDKATEAFRRAVQLDSNLKEDVPDTYAALI